MFIDNLLYGRIQGKILPRYQSRGMHQYSPEVINCRLWGIKNNCIYSIVVAWHYKGPLPIKDNLKEGYCLVDHLAEVSGLNEMDIFLRVVFKPERP